MEPSRYRKKGKILGFSRATDLKTHGLSVVAPVDDYADVCFWAA